MTAVKNAQMAESSLLLIGGAAATILKVMQISKLFWSGNVSVPVSICNLSMRNILTGKRFAFLSIYID